MEAQSLIIWWQPSDLLYQKKRQCSLFKDQLSIQTSTYVHNYSVCPQTVWGHWSLSPSTHSHLDFFLLLCLPDSWCRRVTSGKRREAGSQNHTCIMSYTSLQLHRYWKVSGKDTCTQEPTKNKFKFRLILTWQKKERKNQKANQKNDFDPEQDCRYSDDRKMLLKLIRSCEIFFWLYSQSK